MFIAEIDPLTSFFLCLNNDFTNFWILKKKKFLNIDGTTPELISMFD